LSRRGSAGRRQRQQALADGLVFFDGHLHLADRDSGPLRAEPTRLMKVFWHLHRLGCELSLDLERALEDALYLADGSFQRSIAVRDLFLDICRSWGRVAQTFREMHELGLLGRFLPEFGALTCLVQYDVYTVLGRPALAPRRRAPRGAGPRPVRRVGRRRAGAERGRSPSSSCSGCCCTTSARPGTRARREGHPADPRARHTPRARPEDGALVEFSWRTT
jgi:hypothetical protein